MLVKTGALAKQNTENKCETAVNSQNGKRHLGFYDIVGVSDTVGREAFFTQVLPGAPFHEGAVR